jgi:hypothetical protein
MNAEALRDPVPLVFMLIGTNTASLESYFGIFASAPGGGMVPKLVAEFLFRG